MPVANCEIDCRMLNRAREGHFAYPAVNVTSLTTANVHRVAERYSVYVALHTDPCQADKQNDFVVPLIEEAERRRAVGQPNRAQRSRRFMRPLTTAS